MGRRTRADRIESTLRRADETLEAWFRRSVGVLRQQVTRLQGGLKQLNGGLEQLEKDPRPATTKHRARPTATRRSARPRKTKKAA
jgi:hypothetical protein